jgi:DNA-directed RNA polymerase specialized sigma24 family protein
VGDKAPLWNTKAQLQALQYLIAKLPDPGTPAVEREPRAVPGIARRLKDAEVDELVAAYEAGATVYQLADRFRINRRTVSKIIKRRGVETRWQRLTEADVDEAEHLYAQGWSLARVGERLGVSDDTVRLRLLKRGVQMRDPHWRG